MILDGVKVEFGLVVDKTIETDTVTATETAPSNFSNVYDTLNRTEKQKIAYLEQDYWLLDGSFVMPTDDDIAGGGAVENVESDPSFDGNNWIVSEKTQDTYKNRWTLNGIKSSQHAKVGSNSYLLDFSYSGGATLYNIRYATATQTVFDNSSTRIIRGHKYYIRAFIYEEAYVNFESHGGFYIVTLSSTAGTASYNTEPQVQVQKKKLPNEEWGYISNIVTASNSLDQKPMIGCYLSILAGYDTQRTHKVWFDDLLVVDLTEKYGAGNEPTIEICDRAFNGQKSIVIGYESLRSDENSATLTYTFAKSHDSYGITLKFPSTSIPLNCTIHYFKNSQRLGNLFVICQEDKTVYKSEHTFLGWNKIEVVIANNSLLVRRIRLQEIIFGVEDSYEENELIEVSANKTLNPLADYSESGEMSFSFFNDGRYDINTIKDLSQRVFEELKIQLYIKRHLQSTYELWGTYYVESGKVEENGNIVSFTAHDGLYRLDDVIYENGKVYENGRTLTEWAKDVAKTAGIDIVVSREFDNIVSKGYIAEVPCREAFRLIAEAGRGIFGVDENDVLHLWQRDEKIINKGIIDDSEIVKGSFSLDNPNKIMGIRVKKYTFTKGETSVEIGKLEGITLKSAGEKMVVEFSDDPIDPDSVEVSALNGEVADIHAFCGKVSFFLSGQDGESDTVTITGIPYNKTEIIVERGETKKNIKEITDNYLITENIGEDVADFQNIYATKKYNYALEVLKEETINVGDVFDVQGNTVIITNDGFSISYDDYSEDIEGVDE